MEQIQLSEENIQTKSQNWNGIGSTLERVGNFERGEDIEGNITILSMAPIVEYGVPLEKSTLEQPRAFTGKVDKVNEKGDVVRIKVTECVGVSGVIIFDIQSQFEQYHFQSLS
jgi:hypothetical protein